MHPDHHANLVLQCLEPGHLVSDEQCRCGWGKMRCSPPHECPPGSSAWAGGRPVGGPGGTFVGGRTSQFPPAASALFVRNKVSRFQTLKNKVCVMVGVHRLEPLSQLFD